MGISDYGVPPERRVVVAAIDEALGLDEVTQAMKRAGVTSAELTDQLNRRQAQIAAAAADEIGEYIALLGRKTYIAHTILGILDPVWQQLTGRTKKFFDPIRRLLTPSLWAVFILPLTPIAPVRLETRIDKIRNAALWPLAILYWTILAAVMVGPVVLKFTWSWPTWSIAPAALILLWTVSVFVWGMTARFKYNRTERPRGDILDQQLANRPKLDSVIAEDPDYRAVSAQLDDLARHIQRLLLERSVLPTIRNLLNERMREHGLATDPREFQVSSAPGLGEVDDERFRVPTDAVARLTRLLRQLPGGSVGLSGPRGVGKSTILRALVSTEPAVWPERTLRFHLSAPVHYVPVEFISHLASEICQGIVKPSTSRAIQQKAEVVSDPIEERSRRARARMRRTWASAALWRLFGLLLVAAMYFLAHQVLISFHRPDLLPRTAQSMAIVALASAILIELLRRRVRYTPLTAVGDLWLHHSVALTCLAGATWFLFGKQLQENHDVIILRLVFIVTAILLILLISARVQHWRRRRASEASEPQTEGPDSPGGLETPDGPPLALQAEAESLLDLLAHAYSKMSSTQAKMTSGTSAGIELKGELSHGQQLTVARRELTMPELVSRLRSLIKSATRYGRVLVAIDELDKIQNADDARRFINDVKAIFGLDRSYFVVAVSEDAMVSFERRGLDIRTEIDSAFDEVLYSSSLSFTETRQLLEARVFGLTTPYVQLCYCLSGGLPRDVIRTMRNIVNAGLAAPGRVRIATIATTVLIDEMSRYATATISGRVRPDGTVPVEIMAALASLRDRSIHPRKYHILADSLQETSAEQGGGAAVLQRELRVMLDCNHEVFRLFSSSAILDTIVADKVERLAQVRRDLGTNIALASKLIGEISRYAGEN